MRRRARDRSRPGPWSACRPRRRSRSSAGPSPRHGSGRQDPAAQVHPNYSISERCSTFARSSSSVEGWASNQASRISSSSAGEVVRRERREHVGVVPLAGARRGRGVGAQRGADAADLVGGDRGAGAGPAADDGLLGAALGDVAGGGLGGPRPVVALGVGERAVRERLVAAGAQLLDDGVGDARALVGGDGDPHEAQGIVTRDGRGTRAGAGAVRGRRAAGGGACRRRRATRSRPPTRRRWSSPRRTRELQGGAVPLRRRRAGLPLARRPRPPPDRLPRRGRGAAAADQRGDADGQQPRRAAPRSAPPPRAGVKHMAHRFIVGESPKAALRRAARPVEGRRRLLGRPARRGDASRRPRRSATPSAATRRSRRWSTAIGEAGRSARSSSATRVGPLPRANLSVKVSALTPLMRARRARARQARRRRAPARAAAPARTSSARTCTSTWSRWTRATRCSSWSWSCWPRRSSATGPSAGMVLQAYLRDSPQTLDTIVGLDHRRGRRPRATPLTVRLVKGAYWDHEIVEAAPARLGARRCSRSRPTPTATSSSSRAGCSTTTPTAAACASPIALAQPALGRPRDRLQPARRAATTPTSSCRSCAASATRCRRRSPPRACACAPTARSATSWPAWPTSCAGCWRTRPTTRSSPTRPAACRSSSCCAPPARA